MFEALTERLDAALKKLTGRGKLSKPMSMPACARCGWPCWRPTSTTRWRATSWLASDSGPWVPRCWTASPPTAADQGGAGRAGRAARPRTGPVHLRPVAPTVIILAGLQGSGKTTTAGKAGALCPREAIAPCWSPPTSAGRPPWSSSSPGGESVAARLRPRGQEPLAIARGALDDARRGERRRPSWWNTAAGCRSTRSCSTSWRLSSLPSRRSTACWCWTR